MCRDQTLWIKVALVWRLFSQLSCYSYPLHLLPSPLYSCTVREVNSWPRWRKWKASKCHTRPNRSAGEGGSIRQPQPNSSLSSSPLVPHFSPPLPTVQKDYLPLPFWFGDEIFSLICPQLGLTLAFRGWESLGESQCLVEGTVEMRLVVDMVIKTTPG